MYSRTPVTRTLKGQKKQELAGVRVMEIDSIFAMFKAEKKLQQNGSKSHEQGILPKKNLHIDRSFCAFHRTHTMNYFVSLGILCVRDAGTQGRRGNKITAVKVPITTSLQCITKTSQTVFHPYPRSLEKITICRCHYKGSTSFSVI